MKSHLLVLVLLAATVSGLHAAPQEQASTPPRLAGVALTSSNITIDGALDEEVWRTTPTIGELTQREPRTGDAPTERTEVRLLHDSNALYIGVMSYDSEPDRIIGTEMTRDG